MQIARPDEMDYGWDEVDEVDVLTDKIATEFGKAKGNKARMEMIKLMEDVLEVMTEAMLPCIGCDCVPEHGFRTFGRPSFCGVFRS